MSNHPSKKPRTLKTVGNFPLVFDGTTKLKGPALPAVSQVAGASSIGICFDIDGVFKHGGKWESRGAAALRRVQAAKVPYVFMTNGGGGRTELEYATEIQHKLTSADSAAEAPSLHVSADNIVLSYTPWDTDLAHLKQSPILIVGSPPEKVMNVVKSYGFEHAVHLKDYDGRHPLMNPFAHENTTIDTTLETWKEGFKAICVFTDPDDFFMALQVVVDVLLSSQPGIVEYEEDHQIPIYFSNPDLLWKTQYPFGRFGQGAFRLSLRTLYEARLHSLGVDEASVEKRLSNWVQYGKPAVVQYRHALNQLQKLSNGFGNSGIRHCYMVGDNPHSDMQGCVNMNDLAKQFQSWSSLVNGAVPKLPSWSGVLVRTGVYSDGDDPNEAAVIVDDVYDAIDWILKTSGIVE